MYWKNKRGLESEVFGCVVALWFGHTIVFHEKENNKRKFLHVKTKTSWPDFICSADRHAVHAARVRLSHPFIIQSQALVREEGEERKRKKSELRGINLAVRFFMQKAANIFVSRYRCFISGCITVSTSCLSCLSQYFFLPLSFLVCRSPNVSHISLVYDFLEKCGAR